MIFGKLWHAFAAQFNKLANLLGPIRSPRCSTSTTWPSHQLKEGREGLEQYRALVERVSAAGRQRQGPRHDLEAKIKAYLQAGDRDTAAKFALELQKAKKDLAENEGQLEAARGGLRQQPDQDQARQRQALEDPRQDRQVRRRAEDEPGRGGDGQLATSSTST